MLYSTFATMNLQQATHLIAAATRFLPHPARSQHWADLGCGAGLFTEALAGLLPAGSSVSGIDTKPSLRKQTTSGNVTILPMTADFINHTLPLHNLDGILMANSLHYVKDKPALLQKLRAYMLEDAPLIIIEYDTDTPVPTWVPYPISYASLKESLGNDYAIQKLGEKPSAYGRSQLYAAIAIPVHR